MYTLPAGSVTVTDSVMDGDPALVTTSVMVNDWPSVCVTVVVVWVEGGGGGGFGCVHSVCTPPAGAAHGCTGGCARTTPAALVEYDDVLSVQPTPEASLMDVR